VLDGPAFAVVEAGVELVADGDMEDVVDEDCTLVEGKESEVLVCASWQNRCARLSVLANSSGQSLAIHVTIVCVKFLLEQKQLTSTSLLQFAAETALARQPVTQDGRPLKEGKAALLVDVATEVLLLCPVELAETELEGASNVDGGIKEIVACARVQN